MIILIMISIVIFFILTCLNIKRNILINRQIKRINEEIEKSREIMERLRKLI
jgi:hypothetical protein